MILNLSINGTPHEVDCAPSETLFAVMRRLGYFGVKFGDEQGLTGADTVLLDGRPVNAGSMLAAQAEGHNIVTIEALGEHPDQGWKKTEGLHPLQRAFVETGAIQCGYCTPAQILAAKTLLDKNHNPSEAEVREALSGVLCRCTGYLKPVQAVLRAAAAVLRGDEPGELGVCELGPGRTRARGDAGSGTPTGDFRRRACHGAAHQAEGGRDPTNPDLEGGRQAGKEGGCRQAGAGQAGLRGRHGNARHADRQGAAQPVRPRPHQEHRHQLRPRRCPAWRRC